MLYRMWKKFWARRRSENADGAIGLRWLREQHPGEIALDIRLRATEADRRIFTITLSPIGAKPTQPGFRVVAVDHHDAVVELTGDAAVPYAPR